MMGISLWSNHVLGLGEIILATGVMSVVGWTLLMRSKVKVVGIKD